MRVLRKHRLSGIAYLPIDFIDYAIQSYAVTPGDNSFQSTNK